MCNSNGVMTNSGNLQFILGERSLQQKLSVRISTPLGPSAKGRIQSIDGMSLEEFVVHVTSMHEDRDKQFKQEYEVV